MINFILNFTDLEKFTKMGNILATQNEHHELERPPSRKPSLTHRCSKFPKRLILIRHGESMGNADESQYCTVPDWLIPLTENGKAQSREAGKKIKAIIGDEPVVVFCSPYLRTKQTLKGIMTELESNPLISAREEPRVTEQQFGNFQTTAAMKLYKEERSQFGRFYYRFPQGESGLDVYNRISLFIGTLFREWEKGHSIPMSDANVLIVTHGLTLRLFLMRWFHFSVDEFENSMNPGNAAVVVMTRSEHPLPDDVEMHGEDEHHARYEIDDVTWTTMNLKSTIQKRAQMLKDISRDLIEEEEHQNNAINVHNNLVNCGSSSSDAPPASAGQKTAVQRYRNTASLDLAIMMQNVK